LRTPRTALPENVSGWNVIEMLSARRPSAHVQIFSYCLTSAVKVPLLHSLAPRGDPRPRNEVQEDAKRLRRHEGLELEESAFAGDLADPPGVERLARREDLEELADGAFLRRTDLNDVREVARFYRKATSS
jgi:hypothetical protein